MCFLQNQCLGSFHLKFHLVPSLGRVLLTLVSRELIPIWELPMNLWIQLKQENMSTKFLNIYQTQYYRQSLHEVGKKRYDICGVQPNNMEKGTYQYLQHRVAFQSRKVCIIMSTGEKETKVCTV